VLQRGLADRSLPMNRPYVRINVAMTADGKIDSVARRGASLSSAADRARVDELRADSDAVMVGGRTLLDEDPRLTVKSPELRAARLARGLPQNPAKVGLASIADVRLDSRFLSSGPARRLLYTTSRTAPEHIARLTAAGAEVFVLGGEHLDLAAVMTSLFDQGLRQVLVEGGGTLIAEVLRLDLADELTVYVAPRIFGGACAPTLADGPGFAAERAPRLHLTSLEAFDPQGGALLHYLIEHKE
jgi:2,5-diamino-6-(ribosylamino)-4(3H)-pyrimidinone 5'-phosphate reductase